MGRVQPDPEAEQMFEVFREEFSKDGVRYRELREWSKMPADFRRGWILAFHTQAWYAIARRANKNLDRRKPSKVTN